MLIEENTIPVLMYHEVTDYPEIKKKIRRIDPDYSLSISSFKEHMDCLFEQGYQTISCDELLNHQVHAKKQCVLTFDDGLVGNYHFAFPILKEYGFKATIFVVVDGVSMGRFMNWEQLHELSENGFSIQSHTMTHADLSMLTEQEIIYELSESKKIIEKKVGKEVKYLSLPFGSGNRKVFQLASDLGYTVIFTSSYYHKNLNNIPAIIGRIPIKSSDSRYTYEYLLSKRHNQLQMIMIKDIVKNGIKKIVGLNNYRKVYRLFYRIKLD
jgi:peptidoglycan/xylan/chitin deacetylase (PgdA/CDA1 family)